MPVPVNKFARQAQQRSQSSKAVINRDEQPTVDDQLTRLEEDIRRLKVEFDIYFNGAAKRPPYDTKSRVESTIKRLGDDRTMTFVQRYRYNALTARYTAFRELWRRTLQGREEGRDPLAAARAATAQAARETATPVVLTCADAHTDVTTVKQIYEALVTAKQKCGESTEELSFPRFHHLIATRTDNLKKQLSCSRVRFSIETKDGHVHFKARADKDEGDPE